MKSLLSKIKNLPISKWVGNYMKGDGTMDILLVMSTVMVGYFGYHWLTSAGIGDIAAASLLGKLVNILVIVVVMRAVLRGLDKLIDFHFKPWFSTASDSDKSLYLSIRFLGLCILFGQIMG